MIHYSCDGCGRELDGDEDLRYVVKIEIAAAMEPIDAFGDDERDHLLEIHEMIEHLHDERSGAVGEEVYQRRSFDLCPACHKRFLRNPLGREPAAQLNFSEN